ncbi:MAG: hypothetical protein OHK0029_23770 [Armatimonadaceae bacterium]
MGQLKLKGSSDNDGAYLLRRDSGNSSDVADNNGRGKAACGNTGDTLSPD